MAIKSYSIKEVSNVIKTCSDLSPSLAFSKYAPLANVEEGAGKEQIEYLTQKKAWPYDKWKSRIYNTPDFWSKKIFVLQSRLIINQSGSVLENANLCIHRHFGYPYIPGSAVKGVARHAAWCEWKNAIDEERPQEAKLLAQKIALTFGFPTGEEKLDAAIIDYGVVDGDISGTIAFMAGIPDENVKLSVDIINSHHNKYYAGDKSKPKATDDELPIPIFFPAVEKGARFVFMLAPCKKQGRDKVWPEGGERNELDFAWKYLITGLTINGIGAKTAAGYGCFEYDEKLQADFDLRLKQEKEAEKKRIEKERLEWQKLEEANTKRLEEEKAEKERLSRLSPEGIELEKYIAPLIPESFKEKMRNIANLEDLEKRRIFEFLSKGYDHLKNARNLHDSWKSDHAEYLKVKDNPKKQDKSKAYKRVKNVLDEAQKMGMQI